MRGGDPLLRQVGSRRGHGGLLHGGDAFIELQDELCGESPWAQLRFDAKPAHLQREALHGEGRIALATPPGPAAARYQQLRRSIGAWQARKPYHRLQAVRQRRGEGASISLAPSRERSWRGSRTGEAISLGRRTPGTQKRAAGVRHEAKGPGRSRRVASRSSDSWLRSRGRRVVELAAESSVRGARCDARLGESMAAVAPRT